MGRGKGNTTDQFAAIFGNRRGSPARHAELPWYAVDVLVADADAIVQAMHTVPGTLAPGFEWCEQGPWDEHVYFYLRAYSEDDARGQCSAACAHLGQEAVEIDVMQDDDEQDEDRTDAG
jgi:hypothetical protein